MLRSHVGEPLLDIVRRIIDTTGADVELASAVSSAAPARRDNLDLFVRAVADFQAVDGDVTLPALLAYLTAEDDQGNGLDVATPTAADSVKLLTVHRSKGLEWASVFLVGVCETRFPANRSRPLWTSSPVGAARRRCAATPRTCPQLAGHDKAALDAFRAAQKAYDRTEELRLGYVAFTRAAHRLAVTSYLWSTRATPFGPSEYQATIRDLLAEWREPDPQWRDKPVKGDPNPYDDEDPSKPWPPTGPGAEAQRRLEAAAMVRAADPAAEDDGLDMVETARVADWDAEVERLRHRGALRAQPRRRRTPPGQPLRLRRPPAARGPDRLRPRPGPPDAAAALARRALRHPLPRLGRGPLRPAAPPRPRRPPGPRRPRHHRRRRPRRRHRRLRGGPLRRPGAARRRGRLRARPGRPGGPRPDRRGLRGRPTAATCSSTGRPTATRTPTRSSSPSTALAWAELRGVPLDQVRAVFHYVRTGTTVEPADLPDRAALEALLGG